MQPKLTPLYRHHGLHRQAFDVIAPDLIEIIKKVEGVQFLHGNTFLIKAGRDSYSTYQRAIDAVNAAGVED